MRFQRLRKAIQSGIRVALCPSAWRKGHFKRMVKSRHHTDKFWQGERDPMRTTPEFRRLVIRGTHTLATRQTGFSLIELLVGMSIMAVALLSIAAMFSTGYSDVGAGGKTTMATAAARQMIEDMQTLPFANLPNLNNRGTNRTTDLPAANPERALVRKWRYALAGDDGTWAFTPTERAMWSTMTVEGVPFGGTGRILVVNQSPTLVLVTAIVSVPGRPDVQLSTLISRL